MKILKWLLIVLVLLAAGLWLGGMAISPAFDVARSVRIAAPPEKIFALVAEPAAWQRWSVWNRRDPAMAITYSGPASGAGASWAWKSASEGDGRMTITSADAPQRVAFDLEMLDVHSTAHGLITLAPGDGGTQVTWRMTGDMGRNPIFHWLAPLADRMIGPDFEAGLANLKTLAEKP